MHPNLLLIFAKPPLLGKVKTRLAADIGQERALFIYQLLLEKTFEEAQAADCDRWLFLSEPSELLQRYQLPTFTQQGQDLGERMQNAFHQAFSAGYQRVSIIGSDCYELSAALINRSFELLGSYDSAIGPAHDGGYYLLGLNRPNVEIFSNKKWSTDSVLADTLADFQRLNQTVGLLPSLSDTDTAADLGDWAAPFL